MNSEVLNTHTNLTISTIATQSNLINHLVLIYSSGSPSQCPVDYYLKDGPCIREYCCVLRSFSQIRQKNLSSFFIYFYCVQLVCWEILEEIVALYVLIQLTGIDVCMENVTVQKKIEIQKPGV